MAIMVLFLSILKLFKIYVENVYIHMRKKKKKEEKIFIISE